MPCQGQDLLPGDISDALKHEQSVTTLEGTSEILPLLLWTGKQKPWAWEVLAQDLESRIEPITLTPACCPFYCTRLLVFTWNQLPGPSVANPLGDFYSL